MSRPNLPIILLLLLASCVAATPARGADDLPEWASDLGLFVLGGPPAGVVEITVNGEFAAEVAEGVPPSIEVADLLRAGVNELGLEHRPSASAPADGRLLRVQIARSERVTRFQNVIRDALVEVEVPREAPSEACQETIRFWAGPPPAPPAELDNRYWLIVEGPPVNHRVTVVLNEVPIFAASSGDTFFEITPFVRKGKNRVTFDAVPTCLVPKSGRSGPLRIAITSGEQEVETVTFHGPPLSAFDLPAKRKPKPIQRAQAFRAR